MTYNDAFSTQSNAGTTLDFIPQDALLDRYQADYDYNGGFDADVDMADMTRSISARRVG